MSEDDIAEPYDEPSMELTVETLTGTTFEMRVYPTDTVMDIKNKIQRVEGIPVQHQNLLYQMTELQDFAVLSDLGITSGSTLKLVLSMRGGPISTRRLNTCDHHVIWRDLKELIEHTREESSDRGSKVSVLVFKDGEVLNVIRVIENEDGSYSPYTDKAVTPPQPNDTSSSGGTTLPATTAPPPPLATGVRVRRDIVREDLQQTVFKKMAEDMEMATKMHTLRARMRRARQLRTARETDIRAEAAGGGYGELPDDAVDIEIERRDLLPLYHREQSDDEGSATATATTTASNRMRLARLGLVLQDEQELGLDEGGTTQQQQEIPACSATQCKLGLLKRRTSLDYDGEFGLGLDPSAGDGEPDDLFYRLPGIPRFTTAAAASASSSTTTAAGMQPPGGKCDLYLDSGQLPDKLANRSPLYGRCSRNSNENFLPPLASSPGLDMVDEANISNIERLQNEFLDLDHFDPEVFGYYNSDFDRYITSGVGPNSNLLAGSSGFDITGNYFSKLHAADGDDDEEELEPISLAGDIKKLALHDYEAPLEQQAQETAATTTGAVKRDLPAVVAKKRMRCDQCNKRLNITNIYNCRCGRIFCSQHRYSESHDCKYDYKSEGRKLLEQQNPLVTASKLTKF